MSHEHKTDRPERKKGLFSRLLSWITDKSVYLYEYVICGKVWSDTRKNWRVNTLKTISLSIKSFFNTELQTLAAALTYQTVLAIVPALALLFAIGRGFGFENLLESQLFQSLPAQETALRQAFSFVDSYLSQASEGLFVGIGIGFLLWTLISLISNVESAFNKIFMVSKGRTIWRKITDYTAIFLILPVLMICSSGITVLMSSTLRALLPFEFMSSFVGILLDFASVVLVWLFFAGTYMLIPNTKVKAKNAIISGVFAGTGFMILQWLFVSGQIYVTKYNAIYGSFAFLPLLLIWIQLVWLITLAGGVVCYSSQNIYLFSYLNEVDHISRDYHWRITLAVMVVCTQRFEKGLKPLTCMEISNEYKLPISIVTSSTEMLTACGLLQRVIDPRQPDLIHYAPARDPNSLTLADVSKAVDNQGDGDFLPHFRKRFRQLNEIIDTIEAQRAEAAAEIPLCSIEVDTLIEAKKH